MNNHLISVTTIQRKWRSYILYQNSLNYEDNLYNAVKEMLNLSYIGNNSVSSNTVNNGHENSVCNILKKHKFKQMNMLPDIKRVDALKWIKEPKLAHKIPNGKFIYQPFGTNNSPDFIIKASDKTIIFLEAKSSKTSYPLYNSGGVNSDFIYIFTSKKTDESTIYMGSDIITPQQQSLINEHINNARKKDKELNDKLKNLDVNNRGICFYTRPMINQSGGEKFTNYFKHDYRSNAENNVLNRLKILCESM